MNAVKLFFLFFFFFFFVWFEMIILYSADEHSLHPDRLSRNSDENFAFMGAASRSQSPPDVGII